LVRGLSILAYCVYVRERGVKFNDDLREGSVDRNFDSKTAPPSDCV